MSIQVALTHRTTYSYDRLVTLAPHIVRLRPAPHARTPILSYSLKIEPEGHFLNWQQDAFANWQARLVFPERTEELSVTVDLVAQMVAINPFDFFLDDTAQEAPFVYDAETLRDLEPYLRQIDTGPAFEAFLAAAPRPGGQTIDWLVALNAYLCTAIDYTIRMEPGVQTPDHTIQAALGSCRDSAWLLVAMLRRMGYAARFVSGYLIQLTADQKPIEGPAGPTEDFTDLHAWAEIYLPGAGWVGMDPTSGLFAGEGHIPLACTPEPSTAAAITGAHDKAEVSFDFDMSVRRVAEPPRVTRPLTPRQWAEIDRAGEAIERKLQAQDMRLTMGGEPTFVSATDRDAGEWTTEAVGPTKRTHADALIRRLQARFAPQGLLHHGQGKWYPGEPLPRWAFSLIWRGDGMPLWSNPEVFAKEDAAPVPRDAAGRFARALADELELESDAAQPLYEDPLHFTAQEAHLPPNVTVAENELDDPAARARMIRMLNEGLDTPRSYVIPLQLAQAQATRRRRFQWASERWQTRRDRLFLLPGDSPAGFRLPLGTLNKVEEEPQFQRDPMARTGPLPGRTRPQVQSRARPGRTIDGSGVTRPSLMGHANVFSPDFSAEATVPDPQSDPITSSDDWVAAGAPMWREGQPIRTALAVEVRDGILHVFMPPTGSVEEYIDIAEAVQAVARDLGVVLRIEGYEPPRDPRVNVIRVTPDPGVIEVNIHPAHNWQGLREITAALYEDARQTGLDSFSFMIDGRLTGSGGGNHIVVGGATPEDSPFLRRPDLLGSVVRYWQRHPSLSYLFSGTFIGPTSQAPRFDEGRPDAVYEMEIALAELARVQSRGEAMPWLCDRIFRHLLTDLTGNTHRSEICIDKMFSPDGPTGRLGLVEFRGFEMPPHWQMSMAQALVMRGLLSWFWDKPYTEPLMPWGEGLHDRFLLPHHVWQDFGTIMQDLSRAHDMPFRPDWFKAQFEFRFPEVGSTEVDGVRLTLRNGIEPWLVLGEEAGAGGTSRYVDSSLERVELTVTGDWKDRHVITCNGVELPLRDWGEGTLGLGIRFRSWQPWSSLHPTIPAHAPLVFDVYDRVAGRSLGGCAYHIAHQGGRAHETRPINDLEAEGRRRVRFVAGAHTPGGFTPYTPRDNRYQSETLDMRFV